MKCNRCGGCTCEEPLHMSPYGHCLLGCGGRPDDSLTFAEAMALDPSEVEVRWRDDQQWMLVSSINAEWSLQKWREAKFRRFRPKRSRMQEMAAHQWPTNPISSGLTPIEIDLQARTETIRAVCEWQDTQGGYAELTRATLRHFLEPR